VHACHIVGAAVAVECTPGRHKAVTIFQCLIVVTLAWMYAAGPLPGAWGALSQLRMLTLVGDGTSTALAGTLPEAWNGLVALRSLRLQGLPGISGAVPPSWASMRELTSLVLVNMSGLKLDPVSFTMWLQSGAGRNMTRLEMVGWAAWVESNLAGLSDLPNALPNCTRLSLTATGLTGALPANWQWFRLHGLQLLDLSDNSITGRSCSQSSLAPDPDGSAGNWPRQHWCFSFLDSVLQGLCTSIVSAASWSTGLAAWMRAVTLLTCSADVRVHACSLQGHCRTGCQALWLQGVLWICQTTSSQVRER
jgi:hypothetical protein